MPTLVLMKGVDQWILAATMAQLPKGLLRTDLEVAGSGPVSCNIFIPFSFLPCVVL